MRNVTMIAAAAALSAGTVAAVPAQAHRTGYDHSHQYQDRNYGYGRSTNRCRSGTTGAIVGGAAGALLGRSVAGRRNRTLGTILGGAAGALGGREITRDKNCRR